MQQEPIPPPHHVAADVWLACSVFRTRDVQRQFDIAISTLREVVVGFLHSARG